MPFNKNFYNILCLLRNERSLKIVNKIARIDDYNMIIPNLYLGNIKSANNVEFLKDNNILSIVNCTENEPFNDYFDDKSKFRLKVNDSREKENISKFKKEIFECINFIEESISNNKPVYVHCYWGLMRSATVVASYLIKRYGLSAKDAINLVKEKRPRALSGIYNFNEVLHMVEKHYLRTPGIN